MISARVESLNVFCEGVTVTGFLCGKGLGNTPLFDRITARSIRSAKWIRGITLMPHDQPGFWEGLGYHYYGDPWREQRYSGDE